MTVELESVEQCDRDAAAEFGVHRNFSPLVAEGIVAGHHDYNDLVQAFARHRLSTIPSPPSHDKLREALTPYGETKYAYSGEFSWTEWLPDENGIEQGHERTVPWTTIKEIMAAIRERAGVDVLDEADCLAALSPTTEGERP